MPAYKGTKELGSIRSKIASDHARKINSRVKDSMSTSTSSGKTLQGKGVSLKGRTPKVGDSAKTRQARVRLTKTQAAKKK